MHRRKWDAKTKAMIIIEGLKGKPVAEICTEHQISQSQYWHVSIFCSLRSQIRARNCRIRTQG